MEKKMKPAFNLR